MTAATPLTMPTEETSQSQSNLSQSPQLRLMPDAAVSGSRTAFSQLMREHHLELIVYAGAVVSDREAGKDIVQDALVSAWRKFDQFDDEVADFGAWVRGIIRNKAKDYFRKMKRPDLPDIDWVEMEVDLVSWQSACAAGTGVFERVEQCLSKIPATMREAVQRFYMEDRSGEEAARKLEISAANLRKRLERARSLLHECISREETI